MLKHSFVVVVVEILFLLFSLHVKRGLFFHALCASSAKSCVCVIKKRSEKFDQTTKKKFFYNEKNSTHYDVQRE